MYEIKLSADKRKVIARGRTIVAFLPADAEAQKSSIEDLSRTAMEAVRTIMWRIQFDRSPAPNNTP
jgi:hypothetical protein